MVPIKSLKQKKIYLAMRLYFFSLNENPKPTSSYHCTGKEVSWWSSRNCFETLIKLLMGPHMKGIQKIFFCDSDEKNTLQLLDGSLRSRPQ
jgi:hypothetical protein